MKKHEINGQKFGEKVSADERFEFGKNWWSFLSILDDERIYHAELSLREMLEIETLSGLTFLDVGCGSGLFSLAAMRMGAAQVRSFDIDAQSVACTKELRRRYFPNSTSWVIEHGNVLAKDYLSNLGKWDIVYCWGVLHHTGQMWRALENLMQRVDEGGLFFISIYNDQGAISNWWRTIKSIYNKNFLGKTGVTAIFFSYWISRGVIADLLRSKNPLTRYKEYKHSRGMSIVHDWRDWLGGYPFEVAKSEKVFDYCNVRGFELSRLKTMLGNLGCNEFVFRKRRLPP